MKLTTKKQTALKALLLLVLASQISWETAVHESLQAVDLAATGETVGGTGGSGGGNDTLQPDSGQPTTQAPKTLTVSVDQSTMTTGQGAAPQKTTPPPPAPAKQPIRSELKSFCNDTLDFHINFSESSHGGSPSTQVAFKRAFVNNANWESVTREEFALATVVENKEYKDRIDAHIKRLIETKYCPNGADSATTTATDSAETDEEEKKRIAEGIRNCSLSKKKPHDPLSEEDQLKCNIDKLGKVSVTEKNKMESRRNAMKQIEELVRGPIKKSIRARILSGDEEDVEEGTDLIEEVVSTITELQEDLRLDPYKAEKLKKELQSLIVAGQTYRRSRAYSDDVRDLRNEFSEVWSEYKADPGNPYLVQQLEALRWQHSNLATQIDMNVTNGPYAALMNFNRSGMISSSDIREFISPFSRLKQDMIDMVDPRRLGITGIAGFPGSAVGTGPVTSTVFMGSELMVPSDVASVRSSVAQAARRSSGMPTPLFPSGLNLGNYGMTNTNLSSMVPAPRFNQSNWNVGPGLSSPLNSPHGSPLSTSRALPGGRSSSYIY